MRPRRRRCHTLVVLVLGLAGFLTACTGLPDSGPVVDAESTSSVDEGSASDINAKPPVPRASAIDLVGGFLEVMTASPIRVDVARQYLSDSAAGEWDPSAATIIYATTPTLRDEGLRVTVPLTGAEQLNQDGAWLGRLPRDQQTLEFDLTVQDGEYRITNPPDALVVPGSWFVQRFRQASLYFFDPGGQILVPQPIYVPRGDQLASTLITRLLAGPGEALRRVARSFLPPGLDVAVSVPVGPDGLAEVDLVGEPTTQSAEAVEKMLAQLAWTLRQEPSIRAVRVRIGGRVARGPDGSEDYAVDAAAAYDPNGFPVSEGLFAVRDGTLTERDGTILEPVEGVFGDEGPELGVVAVNLDASTAAAVTRDGRDLLVTALADPPSGTESRLARPIRGTSLMRPAWDFDDRLWVVDRTAEGAVVRYVAGDVVRRIEVPGVSGTNVRSFLISRDGTRFVAVVRAADGDELRVGRVEVDDRRALLRVGSTEPIEVQPGLLVRIRDIVWTSPTTIAVLSPVAPSTIYDVRTVSVDGSPLGSEALATPVAEPLVALVGSPLPGLATYGVTPGGGLLDLSEGGSVGLVGDPATAFAYAG